MPRKKIREFDAKRLIHEHLERISSLRMQSVLAATLIDTSTDLHYLARDNEWVNSTKMVVKPDMLFGQRGKHGLVKLNADVEGVKQFLGERRGQVVDIKGVSGPLTHWLIEPFVPHDKEYYLSINATRLTTEINFSAHGGVDIEDGWDDKVKTLEVSPIADLDVIDLDEHFGSEFPEDADKKAQVVAFIRGVYKVFNDLDFTTIEMNPICFVREEDKTAQDKKEDGRLDIRILDLVAEVDDTALFKNVKKWGDLEFPQPFGREMFEEEKIVRSLDEKTGASLKLTVLNPKGRIWNLVAGGGASVIFADTVADLGFGAELGNYGEYSGAPNEEDTYQYARTVLDLATRYHEENVGKGRALIVGGGIANFTDVAKTFKGIVHALREYKEKLRECNMHIYVRRAGPNYQAGLDLMRKLGTELGVPVEVYGPETHMTSIVPTATQYVTQAV
eukprot:TRINITY_DN14784_c0_g1_i1.p1 TRINITY_DN14784_c0_g1~~TRINITY_DN14784_c0_g1_i1.p1  ORF type:complete len:462 (-),score=139.24 TRINITY_DN14784_c0_g1_i1:317-1657(-)